VGFVVCLFTFFGMSIVAEGDDSGFTGDMKTSCLDGHTLPRGVDPCPILEQASHLISRLPPSTAASLQKISGEFQLERSLRVQQALFREDLSWMQRGYSTRQIDLMVFVAVALSLERANASAVELQRVMEAEPEPKIARRLESLVLYQMQAMSILLRLSRKLEDVRADEIRFYY
jgi:hypothetical protein